MIKSISLSAFCALCVLFVGMMPTLSTSVILLNEHNSTERMLRDPSLYIVYDEGAEVPCLSGEGVDCICPSCAYRENVTCYLKNCQSYTVKNGCKSEAKNWVAAWCLAVFFPWTGSAFTIISKWTIFWIFLGSTIFVLVFYCLHMFCEKNTDDNDDPMGIQSDLRLAKKAKGWVYIFRFFCCLALILSLIVMGVIYSGNNNGCID